MQKVRIAQKLDPIRSAQRRLGYEGIIPKECFKRLSDMVETILDDIEVTISFGVDLQGLTAIEGRACTAVKCVCERCGESVVEDLAVDFKYTPDQKKVEALGINVEYDFVEVDEFGEIDLVTLVEDELILSLPIVPKHDVCPNFKGEWVSGEIEEDTKANPFAVLNELKSKKN